MLRSLALVLALIAGSASAATADAILQQMRQVEAALARIAQEQQSIYQQFQMVQELRRNDERQSMLPMPSYAFPPTSPPNYDDMKRQEEARAQRIRDQQYELDRLYARYRELEEQKRPLLETLYALAQQRAQEQAVERPATGTPP